MQATDRQIADEIVARRRTSRYEELMRRHSPVVFSKTLGILRSRDLAAEVTQQTFIRAYERLDEWCGEGSIAPWLCAIAARLSILFLDKARRRRTDALTADVAEEEYSDAHERRLQQLERAMQTLPEQDRRLLQLHYYKHLTTEAIARTTGLTQANVLVRLHRIRERLRKLIDNNHDG